MSDIDFDIELEKDIEDINLLCAECSKLEKDLNKDYNDTLILFTMFKVYILYCYFIYINTLIQLSLLFPTNYGVKIIIK